MVVTSRWRRAAPALPLSLSLSLALTLAVGAHAARAATITVTSLADDGAGDCSAACTLRDAVASAAAGDVIVLPTEGPYTLGGSEIPLDKPLTIRGEGDGPAVVSGGGASRIFLVTADATLVDLWLHGGHVVGSSPTNDIPGELNGAGGAVWVAAGVTLEVRGGGFEGNAVVGGRSADGLDGSAGAGGGAGGRGGPFAGNGLSGAFGGGGGGG
ncbi:MAG: CSLREA domain-containing protein, partial [Myxococcales bacterium]|nr:CSLREA domain-containing protein [Myxococcales bacterium]